MEKKDLDLDEAREKEKDALQERAAKRKAAWVEKDRKQQEKEKKKLGKAKAPATKKAKKIMDAEFDQAVESLPGEEWNNIEIRIELQKKRDLRKVFKVIAKNQPVMCSKIREMLNWGIAKKQHSYDLIDLLEEMGLVEEQEILKIWAKDYAIRELGLKGRLTKEEKIPLDNFKEWTKSVKPKTKNKYIGISGYWKLTEKGRECVSYMAGN